MRISQELLNEIASYMNDYIREACHVDLAPCDPEIFLKEYLKRDPEFANLLKSEFGIEVEK